MRQYGAVIAAVVQTVAQSQHRDELEQGLAPLIEHGWGNMVAAIRRVLDGERDPEALCEPLNYRDALIVQTILAGIRDPESIRDLTE